jgi:hypothetical protein
VRWPARDKWDKALLRSIARKRAARQAGLSPEEFWLLEDLAAGTAPDHPHNSLTKKLIVLGFARENPTGRCEITKEGLGVIATANL